MTRNSNQGAEIPAGIEGPERPAGLPGVGTETPPNLALPAGAGREDGGSVLSGDAGDAGFGGSFEGGADGQQEISLVADGIAAFLSGSKE